MIEWLLKPFFRKKRAALISAILGLESVLRRRNKEISRLRTENHYLRNNIESLKKKFRIVRVYEKYLDMAEEKIKKMESESTMWAKSVSSSGKFYVEIRRDDNGKPGEIIEEA